MIRKLAPDELTWFLSRTYAFLGHSDPMGFASRAVNSFRDLNREAERCLVFFREGRPVAGAHVLPPEPDEDGQRLTLTHLWYEETSDDLRHLLHEVLNKHPHEAVYFPLYNVLDDTVEEMSVVFTELGFRLDTCDDLSFDLSDVPPVGAPLVLEAWRLESDDDFRDLYERAEDGPVGDRTWSWLKRMRGSFSPDLWFIAHETLDQAPVGYAFCGRLRGGLDGSYYLSAMGVLPEYRGSSEMLRRLVLTALGELATRSPFGRVETTLRSDDPKLISILSSLGFETVDHYRLFVKHPNG